MKRIIRLVLILIFIVFTASITEASDYVLPYPSYMPGHTLYNLHKFWEKFEEFLYFGDMAKVKYHQGLADKYLVEAKTLFEYGQTMLGVNALAQSNDHFAKAILYELDVRGDRKDDGSQSENLVLSGKKHMEILEQLQQKLPKELEWKEEKKESQNIPLGVLLKQAVLLRTYAKK